ncbi:hypothetical protein EV360DRAFT_90299 [Lentinula raphanica]|nr:hypothetical protein EV360DRAFT_90299 [Lentinula raphanica]
MRPKELQSLLQATETGRSLLQGSANGEFILTDVEAVVDSKQVLDLAGIHTLVDNKADMANHHFLTAKACFYRVEFSFEHVTPPQYAFLGEDGNEDWIDYACQSCSRVYNPDRDAQIICPRCHHWFCINDESEEETGKKIQRVTEAKENRIPNHKPLADLSLTEAKHLFRQGPTIRGLGWIPLLYPKGFAPGDQGWLVTGNEALMDDDSAGYPGSSWKRLSWTYDHSSSASPSSIATSMFKAITGIDKYWICPECNQCM